MLDHFWLTYLYQPLFNALIWIYLNMNEIWGGLWCGSFFAFPPMPLTLISERDAIKQKEVESQW